ncbi:MAG TPA: alpha/beta hydrolase [Caulobacteraceae bacterium]|jgi:pimeloyl-ACP methyl ester carboxylesterase|nr:alpha/beta hydrolase [Caulobacteraceae bacterium]
MGAYLTWGLLAVSALIVAAPLAMALNEAWQARRDRTQLRPRGRLVDVGGGRRLHLFAKGEGRVVVLITGGGEPGAFLTPLQDRVAAFARACMYDRPGFGWSDPAQAPMTFEAHARDLHALLTGAAEPGPYLLVAESFGGLIARSFLRLYPGDVAGLLLVDAAEEEQVFDLLPVLRAGAQRQLAVVRFALPLGLVRRAVNQGLGKRFPVDARRELAGLMSRPAHWRASAREIQAYDLTPAADRHAGGFGAVTRPLTVIAHGKPLSGALQAAEPGWREGQKRLAGLSASSRFVVAEHAGHAIAQEDPDLVAAEVRAMLTPDAR